MNDGKSAWMKWNQSKKSKKLTETLVITKNLFFEHLTVEQIAKKREFKQQSVEFHIIELITLGYIYLGDLVDDELAHKILDTFDEHPPESLIEIKNKLPENISYFQIKCVLASINNQPDSRHD
jgi:uncharacterized protein YpbB